MEHSKFIRPREITVGDKAFTVSQIPAIDAQDIYTDVAKSIKDNGLIGMTMLPQHVVKSILAYTSAKVNDDWFVLDTEQRLRNYIPDSKTMNILVVNMIKDNWGFLADGNLLDVLGLEEAEETASGS